MNFIVFSKDNCQYCEKIKQLLKLTESEFVVYTLGKDFDRESFFDKFGENSTFPQVLCNDKKLGGCVDTIKFLRENKVL